MGVKSGYRLSFYIHLVTCSISNMSLMFISGDVDEISNSGLFSSLSLVTMYVRIVLVYDSLVNYNGFWLWIP